ncbi:MAG TPA: hypothetical protein VHA82_16750 [Ramlibacter sp.]|uniref:hypothetical protein n=1 Tax=Ramlibacter sp. TaxID=1917967 RepID=UPI002C226D8F|nr:hypothetical protein [Ramlibacter sp.]HVZ45463.1 hypothetical protein [Ramlibacter sp.]
MDEIWPPRELVAYIPNINFANIHSTPGDGGAAYIKFRYDGVEPRNAQVLAVKLVATRDARSAMHPCQGNEETACYRVLSEIPDFTTWKGDSDSLKPFGVSLPPRQPATLAVDAQSVMFDSQLTSDIGFLVVYQVEPGTGSQQSRVLRGQTVERIPQTQDLRLLIEDRGPQVLYAYGRPWIAHRAREIWASKAWYLWIAGLFAFTILAYSALARIRNRRHAESIEGLPSVPPA